MDREGVIKFDLEWQQQPLAIDASALIAWRRVLMQLTLIGQDPNRYEGLGFGNLSQRTAQGFLVSGSQTGDVRDAGIEHFCEVTGWDLARHWCEGRGSVRPSSESLTHAAVYELDRRIQAVFHVHSPAIWRHAVDLGIAETDAAIAYGTREMALEVERVVGTAPLPAAFSMAGHEDGVVAFGTDAVSTGFLMLRLFAAANCINH